LCNAVEGEAAPDRRSPLHFRGAGKQAAPAERTAAPQPGQPTSLVALTNIMKNNKMRRLAAIALLAFASVWTVACENTPQVKPPASPSPAAPTSPATSPATSPTGSPAANAAAGKADSLVGQWAGAEKASLNITKKGDKFTIDITGKDGTKSFEGSAKGDIIEFTRNGKTESVKASTGAETGVKGLEKETNCVVVTKGTEAYCRK